MEKNLKEVNSYTRELDVKVKWDDLKNDYQLAVNKFRTGHKMKGFRKGKTPIEIIKKSYGPHIEMDFAEKAMNEYYHKVLHEMKITPINRANINHLHFHENEDLHFTAIFEIKPEVKLHNYNKKFKLKVTKLTATETDYENAISEYQDRFSTVKKMEDGAKSGHFIQGDFQELDDGGHPIIGKKLEKRYIKLGSGAFRGQVVTTMEGAKAGDIIKIHPKFEDKEIHYEVTVSQVEEQVLPDLDDSFAQKVDPEVKDMKEFKEKLKKQIQDRLDHEFENTRRQEIINYFVKNCKVDVPESWKKNYLDNVIEDAQKQQGQNTPLDKEKIRETYSEKAEDDIKWMIIREALIKTEDIQASDQNVKEKINEIADNNKENEKQIRDYYKKRENKNRLKEDLMEMMLFEKLLECAVIKEISKTTDEFRKGEKK